MLVKLFIVGKTCKIPDCWSCEHVGSLSPFQQSRTVQALAQIALGSSVTNFKRGPL